MSPYCAYRNRQNCKTAKQETFNTETGNTGNVWYGKQKYGKLLIHPKSQEWRSKSHLTSVSETFNTRTPFRHSRVTHSRSTSVAANAVYGDLAYDNLQVVAEHGLPASPFSGCVGCLILSHGVPSFWFALFLCSPFFCVSCSCRRLH